MSAPPPAEYATTCFQHIDGAVHTTAIVDNLALVKAAPGLIWESAKAFHGFYKGYLWLKPSGKFYDIIEARGNDRDIHDKQEGDLWTV